MKNLILIRHAKSSWESPLKDIDRSLDNRGTCDAHLVANYCLSFLPSTYIIFSSIAKRASNTASIFAQIFLYPLESIIFKEELYTFDASQLEKFIKLCSNSLECIILFGHNEAITNFANKFGDVYIENVPTAGFVSLQFNADSWAKISEGKTDKIIFPKKLKLK